LLAASPAVELPREFQLFGTSFQVQNPDPSFGVRGQFGSLLDGFALPLPNVELRIPAASVASGRQPAALL
jgi:hypothetical protein